MPSHIGKKYYFMKPTISFGSMHFTYYSFVVEKVFKKSAQIKILEDYGSQYGNKIKLELLDKCFHKSKKSASNWCKGYIERSIANFEQQLKTVTKAHEEYQFYKDCIYHLKKYLGIMDSFSIEALKKADAQIDKYLQKRAKFKVGDKIVMKDRRKGVVKRVEVLIAKSPFGTDPVSYYLEGIGKRKWGGTYDEKDIKGVAE